LTSFNFASKEFDEAKAKLGSLKEDPGNEAKLKIYALFKQVNKLSLLNSFL
jgi:acyl-CoA-binding protein